MIDIDIFKIGDDYYFSEVNPRFGGGYPHAYESGVNMPALLVQNIADIQKNGISDWKENKQILTESDKEAEISLLQRVTSLLDGYLEGIVMMKYNEVMIRNMQNEKLIP